MLVPEFLNTVEQSSISIWLRESDSLFGFYFVLLFHTIGLSLLVGANTLVDLRILGFGSSLPLKPLKGLFRIMWTGFWINVITGILLLISYPTKALTNPVFYFKLLFVALGVITMQKISTQVFDANLSEAAMIAKGRAMAVRSLVFWAGAITAGRLLAYTYRYITYGRLG